MAMDSELLAAREQIRELEAKVKRLDNWPKAIQTVRGHAKRKEETYFSSVARGTQLTCDNIEREFQRLCDGLAYY